MDPSAFEAEDIEKELLDAGLEPEATTAGTAATTGISTSGGQQNGDEHEDPLLLLHGQERGAPPSSGSAFGLSSSGVPGGRRSRRKSDDAEYFHHIGRFHRLQHRPTDTVPHRFALFHALRGRFFCSTGCAMVFLFAAPQGFVDALRSEIPQEGEASVGEDPHSTGSSQGPSQRTLGAAVAP